MNGIIKEAIVKIVDEQDLTAYEVMLRRRTLHFLQRCRRKSRAETTDEIAGCATAMREHAIQVDTNMELFEIVVIMRKALIFQQRRHRLQPPEENESCKTPEMVQHLRNAELPNPLEAGSNSAKCRNAECWKKWECVSFLRRNIIPP